MQEDHAATVLRRGTLWRVAVPSAVAGAALGASGNPRLLGALLFISACIAAIAQQTLP